MLYELRPILRGRTRAHVLLLCLIAIIYPRVVFAENHKSPLLPIPSQDEHAIRHQRHHESRSQEEAGSHEVGGSQCPPAIRPVTGALCDAPKCYSHAECPPDPLPTNARLTWMENQLRQRACCYNGCVYSCMQHMPPRQVYDWDGETPDPANVDDVADNLNPDEREFLSGNKTLEGDEDTTAAHVAPKDVVALPGGCVLTHEQYLDYLKYGNSKYLLQERRNFLQV
ncbi:hypothetical protein B566_EDAN007940 [Ephemera danica]|nr:hypothetical protein B566_EDAN007940 [Ephemera danica]